jgi:N-ethylmaleimide reductase
MSTANDATGLFSPLTVGSLTFGNRIVMAPMTRSRAPEGDAPAEITALYYAQRASSGLIVTEATFIAPEAKGYARTAGIYNDRQIEAWRKVTQAVHDAGGRIFCQLWHVGRRSHPELQPGGRLPVAPSAIASAGNAITHSGRPAFPVPRALETEEVPGVAQSYGWAARCAREAGFDGVELHAANGYLVDQFMRDRTNKRTDIYGGSPENRTRFLAMVLDAILGEWPADRIGVRISPVSPVNDMGDSDPEPVFTRAVALMNDRRICYLHVVEGDSSGAREVPGAFDLQKLRRQFSGIYIANNAYDRDTAEEAIIGGRADMVSFGRAFIANPDLVDRLRRGLPLAPIRTSTLYSGGAEGYTDYPAYQG